MYSARSFVFFTLMFVRVSNGLMTSVSFVRSQICNLQNRVTAGCSKPQWKSLASVLKCASLCQGDCQGFTKLQNGTCVLHSTCAMSVAMAPCAGGAAIQPSVVSSANPCLNQGFWNVTAMVCQCNNSWVGTRCERYPTSCTELVTYGYPVGKSDEYTMMLKHGPFKMRCNMVSTVAQNHVVMYNTGKSNNNKTWAEYEEGFYMNTNNYWIGLKNFRSMNELGFRTLGLDTNIQFNSTRIVNYGYRYRNFTISDIDGDYAISFDTATKTTTNAPYGDCLTPVNGSKFSTWDKDNDGDMWGSCASSSGAGWWFNMCDNSTCNPMSAKGLWKMAGLYSNTTSYLSILLYYQNN